jgi:DnaJ-class molecular chaperone
MDPEQAQEIFSQFFGEGGAGGFADILGQQRPRSAGRGRRTPRTQEPVTSSINIPFVTASLGGKVGLRIDDREIEVKVPPGVKEGQKLRVPGQGPGGADLHLELHIEPHPYFRREDDNIIVEVPVTVAEAILGGKVDVPTLDGTKLTVKVPPGTCSGARLRLRGKGIKGGDQFVEIKVAVPSSVDERSKELIEEFAKRNPQDPRAGMPWS